MDSQWCVSCCFVCHNTGCLMCQLSHMPDCHSHHFHSPYPVPLSIRLHCCYPHRCRCCCRCHCRRRCNWWPSRAVDCPRADLADVVCLARAPVLPVVAPHGSWQRISMNRCDTWCHRVSWRAWTVALLLL